MVRIYRISLQHEKKVVDLSKHFFVEHYTNLEDAHYNTMDLLNKFRRCSLQYNGSFKQI